MLTLALIVFAVQSALNLVRAQEPGTPLHIIGVVQVPDDHGIPGAALHVYQTDVGGRFEIRTVRPGGYPRTNRAGGGDRHIPAHIHIDESAAGHPERCVQIVFADDAPLRDPYRQDWVKRLRQPVASVEPEGERLVAHVALTID